MKRIVLVCLAAGLVACSGLAQDRESPRGEQPGAHAAELMDARAVLQIKSEAGTCYWSIAGDDDLLRLPSQDDRFSSILLSARFDEDQLHLSLAGERAPLDTSSLGLFDLGLKDGAPVSVNSFRAVKTMLDGKKIGTDGWEMRVLPPHTKVDTTTCCTCGLAKLSCCPSKGYCIGCGVCGTCCG